MARRIVITDHALDRFAEPHPERGFRIVGQVPGAFRHRERGRRTCTSCIGFCRRTHGAGRLTRRAGRRNGVASGRSEALGPPSDLPGR